MKIPYFAALLMLGASFLTACGDSKDEPSVNPAPSNITITASPEGLELDNTAQTVDLTITANAGWNITSAESWCTVFPSGGVKDTPTTIKVSVTELKTIDARTATLTVRSGNTTKEIFVTQNPAATVELSTTKMTFGGQGQNGSFNVKSNTNWTASSDASWITLSPSSGAVGEVTVNVAVAENMTDSDRDATITVSYSGGSQSIAVQQLSDAINTPEGYHLVWNDEFNYDVTGPSDYLPAADWRYEVQNSYWVNNELQNYVKTSVNGKKTVEVSNGILKINCFKENGKVYSGRIYAHESTGWQYGYFEARIKLPKGKGTWPAYWMMPCNVNWNTDPWPKCGEIDIMEEVGVDANIVSSSLHSEGHNHMNNTQITANRKLADAEGAFHIYALEWTHEYIKTYVDGQLLLSYKNDGSGYKNWPYDKPYYLIFNLAWGGDWGGYAGVDEKALPVTMEVDYIRVFQK